MASRRAAFSKWGREGASKAERDHCDNSVAGVQEPSHRDLSERKKRRAGGHPPSEFRGKTRRKKERKNLIAPRTYMSEEGKGGGRTRISVLPTMVW